jgi:WD40 repeat protein
LQHGDGLKRAFYSIDGNKVYTAGGSRLCLWDLASGKLLAECQPPSGHSIAGTDDCHLTPDGRFLVAIRPSTQCLVYDASTGEFVWSSKFPVSSAAFSDDGPWLETFNENQACTWNMAATGTNVAPEAQISPRANLTCCAIRGDGTLVATGGDDKTARVWDAHTGEAVSPPLKHSDRVISVGFRERGNQLVTVSADAVIRLWTLDDGMPTQRLIHLACATSGQRIDENGVAVSLKPDQIEAEWNAATRPTSGDPR